MSNLTLALACALGGSLGYIGLLRFQRRIYAAMIAALTETVEDQNRELEAYRTGDERTLRELQVALRRHGPARMTFTEITAPLTAEGVGRDEGDPP